jgi:hypothetical protein
MPSRTRATVEGVRRELARLGHGVPIDGAIARVAAATGRTTREAEDATIRRWIDVVDGPESVHVVALLVLAAGEPTSGGET